MNDGKNLAEMHVTPAMPEIMPSFANLHCCASGRGNEKNTEVEFGDVPDEVDSEYSPLRKKQHKMSINENDLKVQGSSSP